MGKPMHCCFRPGYTGCNPGFVAVVLASLAQFWVVGAQTIAAPGAMETANNLVLTNVAQVRHVCAQGTTNPVQLVGVVKNVQPLETNLLVRVRLWGGECGVLLTGLASKVDHSGWINAEVFFEGFCASTLSRSSRFLEHSIEIRGLGHTQILRPAPSEAINAPVMTIGALHAHAPEELPLHRVRLTGVVLLHRPGRYFFLRDATGPIKVFSPGGITLQPGDRVRVSGFASSLNRDIFLEEADCRKFGSGPEPLARPISLSSSGLAAYHGDLVTIEGHLIDWVRRLQDEVLVVQQGTDVCEALLDHGSDHDQAHSWRLGSRLRLTGVLRYPVSAGDISTPMMVELRQPSDVVVVVAGPWWTSQKLLSLGGVVGGGVVVILIWAGILRSRLKAQTKRIREQVCRELALEERYRQLVENTNDIIYSHDLHGKFISINLAATRITGYHLGEISGLTYQQVVAPEHQPMVRVGLRRLLAGIKIRPFECHVMARDGRRLILEVNPMLEFRGQRPHGVTGIARDVTDRKRAESLLRESEEKNRLVVENATEAMAVTDHDGTILIMNRVASQFVGPTSSSQTQKTMWDLFPKEWADQQMEQVRQVILEGKGLSIESAVRMHGQERWFSTRIEPIRSSAFLRCALIVSRDVTERVEMEVALKQSQAALERSQGIGKVGSWELDLQNGRLYWSPELYRLLGYAAEACRPSMEVFYATLHPADRDLLKAAFRAPEIEGNLINMDVRLMLPGKIERPVNVQAQVIGAADGKPGIIAGTVQDVSERKALEDQLRQTQKMEAIGQLAGGIAHDFNNILTVIMGHIELLLAKGLLDMPTRKRLIETQASAQRASNLTRQLLAFSRRQVLQRRLLDLNEVTSNMATMLRRLLGEHIILSFQYAPNLPAVLADPGMMEQVLLNLAVNARDAMPEGGHLIVSTRVVRFVKGHPTANPQTRQGHFVCWSVQDTGCGIPLEIQERVFEPFFTTKESGKGTGMGLATVYGIIQQHGGWIEVKSDVSQGALFRLFLPATERVKSAETASPQAALHLPTGSETILVVEDEPSLRELERNVLEQQGYRVYEAAHGIEALKVWNLQSQTIDLLLTDMVMPGGMSGRELAQKLQAMKSSLKIIYTTGYSIDLRTQGVALREGVNFLQKPFGPAKLATAVRDCLDGK
jgi:two-component system, cell cycle sensor histidine kinase and response regulator CckA